MSRRCHVLYYPLVLPHDPWIEPPGYPTTGDFPGEFRESDGRENLQGAKQVEERQRRFAAMVEYVDKLVGRVTARLNALKLSEKTLVVFTGDRGTYWSRYLGPARPPTTPLMVRNLRSVLDS